MSGVRFVRDPAGFRAVLNSPEAEAVVSQYAQRIASQAALGYKGPAGGFAVSSSRGSQRVNAIVTTTTPDAKRAQLRGHLVERGMGSVGDVS